MEGVCREGLQELGWNLDDIIPEEADAGLGNGGPGQVWRPALSIPWRL
jgi:starch phosphorylase